MVTVNVVVLAGTVAADPVERRMPSGDEVTELRLSVPETGKRLLPLPVAVWHKDVGKRVLKPIAKGDDVLVYGQLVRRFYRSGAGARSLTEVVAAGIKAFEMLSSAGELRERLAENTRYFRERMTAAGFDIKPGVHPIAPVMLYDAPLAQKFAQRLLEEGIYAIGFFFPVVPKGQARIRTQMSAAHTREHLDRCIDAFVRIGKELGVVK